MPREKFRINIIDFIPYNKKLEVGKYADGSPACIGDCVKYNNEENWLIAYRYGKIMLKQVGMMAIINDPITLQEIKSKTGLKISSIKSMLTRLVKEGKIERIKLGLYAKKGTDKIIKLNPIIKCSCGCGTEFLKLDSSGRERSFISGHNAKIKSSDKTKIAT